MPPIEQLPVLALRALLGEALALAILFVSFATARRLLAGERLAVRWAAVPVLGFFVLTAVFHGLLWVRLFNLPAAAVVIAAAALAVHARVLPFRAFLRELGADLSAAAGALAAGRRNWRLLVVVAFAACLAVPVAKTLLMPPLGWDSLTYHYAKAAMWVQNGGPLTLDAPGGWSSYRLYFGGYDLLPAWTMLVFRSDLAAPFVDAIAWLSLGLTAYALGRSLGLGRWTSAMSMFFLLSIPAVSRGLAGGYSELPLAWMLLASVLFAQRYGSSRSGGPLAMGLVALGLAAGIKVNGLIAAAPAVAVLLLAAVVRTGSDPARRGRTPFLLAGMLLATLPALPWLIDATVKTGCPLSPMPIRVLGIPLGVSNATMNWLSAQPVPWDSAKELFIARQMFTFEPNTLRFGPFALVPLALLPFALVSLVRRRQALVASVAGIECLALLGSFYHPGFAPVRQLLGTLCLARFLLPLVALAVALAPLPVRGLGSVLAVLTAFHLAQDLFWGDAGPALSVLPLVALALLAVAAGSFVLVRRSRFASLAALAAVLPVLVFPPLSRFRESTRYETYGNHKAMAVHAMNRYWTPLLPWMDEGAPTTVAVTAGPYPSADTMLFYAVMGSRLQNRVTYVPVTASGGIGPYDSPDQESFRKLADYGAWRARLKEQGIGKVVSFIPASIELDWMRSHPADFEPLAVFADWGVFRVK